MRLMVGIIAVQRVVSTMRMLLLTVRMMMAMIVLTMCSMGMLVTVVAFAVMDEMRL